MFFCVLISQIWYVSDHTKYELPQEDYGTFFSQNSYIMLYSYRLPDGERRWLLYYWQGRHSSKEDQGTCALLVKEMGGSLGMACSQVLFLAGKCV